MPDRKYDAEPNRNATPKDTSTAGRDVMEETGKKPSRGRDVGERKRGNEDIGKKEGFEREEREREGIEEKKKEEHEAPGYGRDPNIEKQ